MTETPQEIAYKGQVLEAIRNANASSSKEGHWSNLSDIAKAAKTLGVKAGLGWNRLGEAVRSLEYEYLLETTTLSTTFGFEEVWRDSMYTLKVLQRVHKTK